jgi:hypothetical protein
MHPCAFHQSEDPQAARTGHRVKRRGRRHPALSLRWLTGLLICPFQIYGELKPLFGHQEPSVDIFRPPSLSSLIQTFRSIFAISVGSHTISKINTQKMMGRTASRIGLKIESQAKNLGCSYATLALAI